MADVQSLLKHSVDPRLTIRVRAGMNASFATADATQLEQVLLKLCLNARDALTAENGIIEIGIENVMHLEQDDAGTAEFAMIVVRDNGHGTGLGLSMAQDIVREHGGWIEFDSVENQGTEFRVFLPRSNDPENIEEETPNQYLRRTHIHVSQRDTILVVDDEAPVRSIVKSSPVRWPLSWPHNHSPSTAKQTPKSTVEPTPGALCFWSLQRN